MSKLARLTDKEANDDAGDDDDDDDDDEKEEEESDGAAANDEKEQQSEMQMRWDAICSLYHEAPIVIVLQSTRMAHAKKSGQEGIRMEVSHE